jgi:hypothetical protein
MKQWMHVLAGNVFAYESLFQKVSGLTLLYSS